MNKIIKRIIIQSLLFLFLIVLTPVENTVRILPFANESIVNSAYYWEYKYENGVMYKRKMDSRTKLPLTDWIRC